MIQQSMVLAIASCHKHLTCPLRFIDSEADLDAAIKALLPLSQSPSLAYPELVRSGTITLLVGLLTHENMDIVIDVIELIYELTDEDAEVDYADEDYENSEEALGTLVDGLVCCIWTYSRLPNKFAGREPSARFAC